MHGRRSCQSRARAATRTTTGLLYAGTVSYESRFRSEAPGRHRIELPTITRLLTYQLGRLDHLHPPLPYRRSGREWRRSNRHPWRAGRRTDHRGRMWEPPTTNSVWREPHLPRRHFICTSGTSPRPAAISAARSASLACRHDLHQTCTREPVREIGRQRCAKRLGCSSRRCSSAQTHIPCALFLHHLDDQRNDAEQRIV